MTNKKYKVTLTDEPPVMVTDEKWPIVATVDHDRDHNNQELFRRHYLRVRKHTDGRCLCYGWHESSYQGEHGSQAGYSCPVADVVATIRKVGERIEAPQWLIDDCVADLPTVEEGEDVHLGPIFVTLRRHGRQDEDVSLENAVDEIRKRFEAGQRSVMVMAIDPDEATSAQIAKESAVGQ